ncbi:hypothetical protein [Marinilabilia rubra]|uniref:Uncharacterized protein n=1 Tax=Marinilabilia rubra TaxID=2162893 RepID=A0A2U2BBM1_9BACT|nr:hypothetical protein [Marinilabilia rubra]PWE00458.1 hypothetical protein DDZ16_05885 [Marinilabilia rubra]
MFSKFSLIGILLFYFSLLSVPQHSTNNLTDKNICHILNTLPRMVPQLREAGINVSQAYYNWPRDAALHEKGEIILDKFEYDALRLNALEVFCKTWFCLNYEKLNPQRQKILSTTEEQITENPYITDEQKRINIRMLNKELGHSREQLCDFVGKTNLRMARVYCIKTKEIWKNLNQ